MIIYTYVSIIFCIFITLLYNIFIIIKYKKIPQSLSETSYLLGGNKRYFFTIYCFFIVFCMAPTIFNITPNKYEFLPFLFFGGLLFSGCTPLFKFGMDRKVHYISAYISFISFVLYMIFFDSYIYILLYIIIVGMFCILKYKSYVYWAELFAVLILCFYAIYKI